MIYEVIKRTIDILGAIFLLILFFPIMLIAAIAVKLTSQGPLLVEKTNKSSIRVGKYGKKFYLYKLRSMIVGAHELLHNDPKYKDLLKEYQRSSYKLHHDPRLTPIGKFLRKHSIDEMPQLFNVLEGKMSIVGPRAYLPDELEKQQKKYPKTKELVKEVLTIKPGITGFWQVSGRSEVNFDKRIEMDAYYARKKSIILDILILLKTPWTMVTGKGAV